jgi:dsDNA-specific endonuclease/ATPase MutS2
VRRRRSPSIDETDSSRQDPPDDLDAVRVEITDVLDLHSFAPAEVSDLVRHYLEEALARSLYEVRIIHGRGSGVQRRTVREILRKHPAVIGFDDAPPQLGLPLCGRPRRVAPGRHLRD